MMCLFLDVENCIGWKCWYYEWWKDHSYCKERHHHKYCFIDICPPFINFYMSYL